MSRDGCVALPRGAMGFLGFVIVVFPDHTNLLFFYRYINGKKKRRPRYSTFDYKGAEVVLPSQILIRQNNLMVSSRMYSIKTNIARSFF